MLLLGTNPEHMTASNRALLRYGDDSIVFVMYYYHYYHYSQHSLLALCHTDAARRLLLHDPCLQGLD